MAEEVVGMCRPDDDVAEVVWMAWWNGMGVVLRDGQG